MILRSFKPNPVIEDEARTRIIWGEKPTDIEELLSHNGYPAERAKHLVNNLLCERYRIVRRRGVQRLLLGATVVVVCAWILFGIFSTKDAGTVFSGGSPDISIGCFVVGFFWGIWKTMDGLRDLFLPKGASGDLGFH
jgi:hypothetical protein